MMEFKGGRLDGMKILKADWPKHQAWPGTEIIDKPSGQLYRYHKHHSVKHAVYTHRPEDSANAKIMLAVAVMALLAMTSCVQVENPNGSRSRIWAWQY